MKAIYSKSKGAIYSVGPNFPPQSNTDFGVAECPPNFPDDPTQHVLWKWDGSSIVEKTGQEKQDALDQFVNPVKKDRLKKKYVDAVETTDYRGAQEDVLSVLLEAMVKLANGSITQPEKDKLALLWNKLDGNTRLKLSDITNPVANRIKGHLSKARKAEKDMHDDPDWPGGEESD